MNLREQELYMAEDDRYERVHYSTHYTTGILATIKNYLKTFYKPKN